MEETTLAPSRRAVVATGAVGAASLVLLPQDAIAAAPPSRERWETLIGRTFTATLGGRRVRVRLDEVEDVDTRPRGLGKKARRRWRASAYQLRFSTPARPAHPLTQGTWTLRHWRTGRVRVFLVPGAQEPGRRTGLTATFNGWRG